MRGLMALGAALLAAVMLSACGSDEVGRVSAPSRTNVLLPGAVLYTASAPSHGLGVDNTDLLAVTADGHVLDLTSTDAAESSAAWSPDGSHVVFERESTSGHENGAIAFEYGIYTWSPGNGAPTRIASCSTKCSQSEFAWSPDNRQIAFLSGDGQPAISVMNADGSDVHTVCDVKRCGPNLDAPLWSPDGRKLVFSNGGISSVIHAGTGPDLGATGATRPWIPISNVWVANADGSGVEQLGQPSSCKSGQLATGRCGVDTAPAWSPDGKLIAFRRHAALEVMDADGSHVHSIATCHGCILDPRPVWSPDGKAIAYAADQSIHITTLEGETSTIRTCQGSNCLSPMQLTWSPDGDQLAFFSSDSAVDSPVWVVGRGGEALRRIATGADTCCLAWAPHVSLSGAKKTPKIPPPAHLHLSGTIAYDSPNSMLTFLPLGGRGYQVSPIAGLQPSWSPDGGEIAYAGGLGGSETGSNIWVSDRHGGHQRILTHFENGAGQPAWSPDGRTIAFYGSDHDYPYSIWLVSATGGHLRRVVANDGISQSWNPSSSELLFSRQGALYTIHPDGSGLHRVTNLPGSQEFGTFSPDGKEIAFTWMTPSGMSETYLIHPDGTHLRRLTASPGIGGTAWSPDSRYLAGLHPAGDSSQWPVFVIDVKTGRYATVAQVPRDSDDLTWSAR